jgi:hypothetical protein
LRETVRLSLTRQLFHPCRRRRYWQTDNSRLLGVSPHFFILPNSLTVWQKISPGFLQFQESRFFPPVLLWARLGGRYLHMSKQIHSIGNIALLRIARVDILDWQHAPDNICTCADARNKIGRIGRHFLPSSDFTYVVLW